jgi:hypothetical protein
MKLTSQGYDLKFIQTHPSNVNHELRYVFKFFSQKTRLHYIVYADYHEHDFFGIKFYAKKDRKSNRKYSNIVNKGDVSKILITCAKSIPELLKIYPKASFGFIGARSIDYKAKKVEGYKANQRFRLYTYHIPQLIGDRTFLHKSFPNASSYILLNRKNEDLEKVEKSIKNTVCNTYPDLLNIEF